MRWYTKMGKRVWPHEIRNFLLRNHRTKVGPTVAQFRGAPQDTEEEALAIRLRLRIVAPAQPGTSQGLLDRRAIRLRRD